MTRLPLFSSLALVLATGSPALADAPSPLVEWTIDAAHTHVGFEVAHLVVSSVEGEFKAFSGTAALDEKDLTKSQLSFSVKVDSINTDNADRDKHLKSADFFDAAKFPTIDFKSTKIVKAGKGYKITGELTMRGVTKSITLDATLSAPVQNPWGKQVRGGKLTGKLDRRDFGVSWNKALDKSGVVVGEQVLIEVKLELNR